MRFLAVLLLLAGVAVPQAGASDFLVTNWRNEEGLPHSIINSIVQSQDGYLWLGTYVGLVRFDGVKFRHYSSLEIPELGSGRISRLFEDRDGTLWIGLESGRVLAWKDGVVATQYSDRKSPGGPVVAMAQDKAGTIWLQTSYGYLAHLTNDGLNVVARTGPVSNRPGLRLVMDGEGTLWVGTRNGLEEWQHSSLVTPPGLASLQGTPVEAMAPAQDGSVWMFHDRHLIKVHAGEIKADIPAPANLESPAAELLETPGHLVWLAAEDGNLFYLPPSGTWQVIPPESGLRGANRTLCLDREGDLWRGSFGGGLARLRPQVFVLHELAQPLTLDRYATSVCSDSAGNVWGLFSHRTLARIPAGAVTPQLWPDPKTAPSIHALFCDRQDTLWAAGDGGALYRLQDGTVVPTAKVGDTVDAIGAFFEDRASNLWVGFPQGVGYITAKEPARCHLLKDVPFPDVRAIAQGADGSMWFGTHYGGACRWNNGRWTLYTTHDGLCSDYVRCFHTDPDGTVWLGTIRGLCRWRDGRFVAIRSENGLWNDSISHIAEDRHGNFWISSFGGVFRVARQELNQFADGQSSFVQCVRYDRTDGLPSLECPGGFQPAGTTTPDGRLWFPTVAGVVSVAPDQIPRNDLPPPVWVEAVVVDRIPMPVRHSTAELAVGPGKRGFEFRFTALSLVAPEKVRFRHQLEGLDSGWSNPDPARSAAYNFIPPGHYTFRVTACNNDGVWNTTGAALALVVRPFYWQTWWFKAGLGVGLALLLAWAVLQAERWRSRLRVQRLEQQRALDRERARIAKDIHDDLGASLAQIALITERVEEARGNPAEVQRSNRRIADIAHRTIQSLDEIVWAVSPKNDTLESLANYLSQFAQEHLALAKVRCVLEVPTVLPALELRAEVRHNLLLATREAVQNVVAHARATEVRVALRLDPSAFQITVADNGCGFSQQRAGEEGNGLSNMRRRLTEIGGELEIVSSPEGGTTVRFSVPHRQLSQ
jgi:signal transduction histidine kinase/ligand-binding sensor domain-containing protein